MSDRETTDRRAIGDRIAESPEGAFRIAFGGYLGALVAGVATVPVTVADASWTAIAGAAAAGFLGGAVVGVALAGRSRGLPARLGRSWRRRVGFLLPAAPFGLAAGATWLARLELHPIVAAFGATVAITGLVAMRLAETCYADSITADEPAETLQWEPPSAPKLDAIVFAMWLLLGAANASGGDWFASILWTGLAVMWLCGGLAEGRLRIGSFGATSEIRIHEAGLVKQRPYTRSFVPWSDVSHVRLRDDELVLERGLFDVRFDRDQLPDLEAARAAIGRYCKRLSNGASGSP